MRSVDAAATRLPADTSYAAIGLLMPRNHDQPFSHGSPNQQTAYVSVGKNALRVHNEHGDLLAEQIPKAASVTREDDQFVLHVRDKKFKIIDIMAIEPGAPFDTSLATYQSGIEPLFTLLEAKGATVQRHAQKQIVNLPKLLLTASLGTAGLLLLIFGIMLLLGA